VALWASTTQRHGGDIDLGTWRYRSTGYAVVSSTAAASLPSLPWIAAGLLAGGVLVLAAGVALARK
jgi:hypothetical protein